MTRIEKFASDALTGLLSKEPFTKFVAKNSVLQDMWQTAWELADLMEKEALRRENKEEE